MNRIPNHRRGRVMYSLTLVDTAFFESMVEKGSPVFTCLGANEGIIARMKRPVSGSKSFYLVTDREEYDEIRAHAERRKARLDWFWYKKGHHPGSSDYIHANVTDIVIRLLRRPPQQ